MKILQLSSFFRIKLKLLCKLLYYVLKKYNHITMLKKNEKLMFHPIPMYMEKLYDIILQYFKLYNFTNLTSNNLQFSR